MSKRRNRSEELPDWADDVTPADEVMKKFYAPTGVFKPGPIVVPAPPALEPNTADESSQTTQKAEVIPSDESTAFQTEQTVPAAPETSLSAVELEENNRVVTAEPAAEPTSVSRLAPKRRSAPSAKTPSPARPTSSAFEGFAARWRRYLYPGQMSVMRVLFEKTVDAGLAECFTRYSELARETKMTRRNCINVVNSLVDHGFVERLEVLNEAKGKGIRLKVNTEPRT